LVHFAIYRWVWFRLQCFWIDFNTVLPFNSILSASGAIHPTLARSARR
jgi:hypothetical protein